MVIYMAKPYEKSAKDKAFDRERIKLHAIIQRKDQEIVELRRELKQVKDHNTDLENIVAELETKIGIPKETILKDIERNKKIESYIKLFRGTFI